mgnify:CR=1 FL=1
MHIMWTCMFIGFSVIPSLILRCIHLRVLGWDDLVLDLRAAGARMLTYINPYLSNDVTASKPHFHRDLWAEANASGYLIMNSDGTPYIQVSSPAVVE